MSGWTQYPCRGSTCSPTTHLMCGIPQRLVLRPVLFILCTVDTVATIHSHGLSPHLYADDTRVYGSCRPAAVSVLSSAISECTADVASWMRSNRLQLNYDKTEVLWCTTGRRQHQLPAAALLIDGALVSLMSSARDLGTYIDTDLVMQLCQCVPNK